MAEKKYYWLKMTDQFFEDKAIKKLEPSLWRHTKQETPMEAASNESESCHT